jgi:hypothetical protein
MSKMNRRQLFLSTAKAALAAAFGGSWLSAKAKAETQAPNPAPPADAAPPVGAEGAIQGTPGSPGATVSIDGRVLPPTPPAFGGVIKESALDSTPWWPPRVVPPKGAPNILLIMIDDQGYGVSSTFGGVIPTPALDRVAKAGLRWESGVGARDWLGSALNPGRHTIVFDFKYDRPGPGKGGTGVLSVDDKELARKTITHTIPLLMSIDETFDIGADTRTPVDDSYDVPFRFTGKLPSERPQPKQSL